MTGFMIDYIMRLKQSNRSIMYVYLVLMSMTKNPLLVCKVTDRCQSKLVVIIPSKINAFQPHMDGEKKSP